MPIEQLAGRRGGSRYGLVPGPNEVSIAGEAVFLECRPEPLDALKRRRVWVAELGEVVPPVGGNQVTLHEPADTRAENLPLSSTSTATGGRPAPYADVCETPPTVRVYMTPCTRAELSADQISMPPVAGVEPLNTSPSTRVLLSLHDTSVVELTSTVCSQTIAPRSTTVTTALPLGT